MSRVLAPFLLFATPCWAHPGHGEVLGHIHGWDWSLLLVGVAIAALAVLAVWKVK